MMEKIWTLEKADEEFSKFMMTRREAIIKCMKLLKNWRQEIWKNINFIT
jgi:hypothetical protein